MECLKAAAAGTSVLEFGLPCKRRKVLRCGMARAQEVFVVVDGAVWPLSIEDRFSGTTQTLDFYHASQRLWETGPSSLRQ